jgi:hypothetical protein
VQNSLLPGVEVYGGFWKDIGGLSGVSVKFRLSKKASNLA